jgi:hypothetical protein
MLYQSLRLLSVDEISELWNNNGKISDKFGVPNDICKFPSQFGIKSLKSGLFMWELVIPTRMIWNPSL